MQDSAGRDARCGHAFRLGW